MEKLKHIKNCVIAFSKNGRTVVYVKGRYTPQTLFDWQRRLRIRSTILGADFTTYHPDMDFSHAIALGWVKLESLN